MANAKRDDNRHTTLLAVSDADGLTPLNLVAKNSSINKPLYVTVDGGGGFSIPLYDYISLSQTATTDVFTYKTGGAGGTTVGTITITYTDSGKGTLSTVVKT